MNRSSKNRDEYCVYTFDLPCEMKANKLSTRWEKKLSTFDYDEAIREASRLYDTSKYQRVEIKKKFINHRKNCMESKVVKSFMSSALWFKSWLIFR